MQGENGSIEELGRGHQAEGRPRLTLNRCVLNYPFYELKHEGYCVVYEIYYHSFHRYHSFLESGTSNLVRVELQTELWYPY